MTAPPAEVPLTVADVPEKRPVPVGLVLLLGALTAFGPISIDMYLPALPAIARGLHGTQGQAEQSLSAFFIGLALGQLAYGPVSDRMGRRRPLLFGIAVYVAASVACAFAPSLPVLIGLRLVQGLGGCAGMVIARAVVRDRFEHHQVIHVLSLLLLVMGAAPILAPLLGGLVLAVADWRTLFLTLAGFGALAGAATFFALPESRSAADALHARGEHPVRSYVELLRRPRLVGYLLTGSLAGSGLLAYVSTSAALIIGTYHVSPQLFGWVFGLNAAGYIGAGQLNRGLVERWGSDRVLRTANLVALIAGWAVLAGAVTGIGGPFSVLVPLFCMMAMLGFNQPNAVAGALGEDPRRAGATSALVGSAGFGLGAVSATLAGLIPAPPPLRMGMVIALVMTGSVVAFRTLVAPRRREDDVG